MRPVTLTFSGLRSYLSTASIDFSDLDCFAVIGDTGAGKSTILEALSIALYGQATWAARQDVLIADGVKQLRVELCFEMQGQRWTVTRSWKRSGANDNKLVGPTPGDAVDGAAPVTARISELLGLDFAQFTRAVVLPQGKFDALLMQRPAERNRTLKTLLGVGELTAVEHAARQARTRWHDHIEHAAGARAGLPADPDATVAAAASVVDAAKERVELLGAAVDAATVADAEVRGAQETLSRLEPVLRRVPAVDVDESLLRLSTAAEVATSLRQEFDALAARQRAHVADSQHLRETAAATITAFARADDAIAAVQRLRQAADDLPAVHAAIEGAQMALDAIGTAPPEADLAAVTTAVGECDAAHAAAADAAAAAASAHRVAADRVSQWQEAVGAAEAASNRLAEANEAVATTAAELDRQLRAAADAQQALDDAEREVARLHALHAAAGIASHHGPGDTCPVCSQTLPDTFAPPAAPALEDALAARAAADEALHSARRALDACRADDARVRAQAAASAEAATAAQSVVERLSAELGSLGVDLGAADPLTGLCESAARADEVASESAAAAAAARDDLAAAQRAADRATSTWEIERAEATRRLATAEQSLAAITTVIAGVPEPWTPASADPAHLHTAVGQLEAAIRDRTTLLEQAQAEDAAASEVAVELDALRERRDAQVMQPVSDIARVVAAWREVVSALDGAPLVEIPSLQGTEGLPDVVAAITDVLVGGQQTIAAAHAAVDRARAEMTIGEDAVRSALEPTGHATLAEAREARAAGQAALDHAVADLDTTTARASHARAIDAFLDVAVPYEAVLDTIVRAMRNGQFVDHVIGAREQELLAEASRRLRQISDDRHGFVDDFGVVSLQSGETRPPEALSGGERFQASLALALALVEIAARGAGQLEAIFVDEGFGSLDTESLHSALDTLITIAGTGRQVGLISHLRAVAEGVDTVFHVAKDPTSGSVITRLGPDERDRLLADDGAGLL